jgi:hypothetical protein
MHIKNNAKPVCKYVSDYEEVDIAKETLEEANPGAAEASQPATANLMFQELNIPLQ